MIRGYSTLTCEDRLERCGLTTLDKIRRRGDLIDTNKLMNSKEAIRFLRVLLLDTGIKSSENRKVP